VTIRLGFDQGGFPDERGNLATIGAVSEVEQRRYHQQSVTRVNGLKRGRGLDLEFRTTAGVTLLPHLVPKP
jgi:hypothetical protein